MKNNNIVIFVIIIIFISLGYLVILNKGENTPEVSRSAYIMNTVVQVRAYGENAQKIVDESIQQIREIEDIMSVSVENSDIYRINSSPGQAVKVREATLKVIIRAVEYAELTDGLFDPSIGPLVNLWGIGSKNQRVPSPEEIEEAKKLVNYRWIEVDSDKKTVKLTIDGMKLDLGAIVKGYAADEVRKIVKKYNGGSAFVNLGGNILVIGSKVDGSAWKIGIQDPRRGSGGVMGRIQLKDKTIVTSGNYERYFLENGELYHHIIDPRTGRPSRNRLLGVSVITENSIDADALSTSIFLSGLNYGMEMVDSLPGVEAIFITDQLEVVLSSGINDDLEILDNKYTIITDFKDKE